MASFSFFPLLSLLLVLASSLHTASARLLETEGRSLRLVVNAAVIARETLPDNAACKMNVDDSLAAAYCQAGPFTCLIDSLPTSKEKALTGVCNSSYALGSYCTVGEFNFKTGVKNIPAYGPMACETCSCNYHPHRTTQNKATCDCDPLPACYVHSNGTTVAGKGCDYTTQSQCFITHPSKSLNGISKGRCRAPWKSSCVSAGPTWGPLFYVHHARNIPFPGDKCKLCRCAANGKLVGCKKVPGCT
jgi:hypothetical protein